MVESDHFSPTSAVFNGFWLPGIHRKGKDAQLPLLQHFLMKSMMFPGLCKLILILMASAANTTSLESSYSILETFCAKYLETLYLFVVLKINDKSLFQHENVTKLS